MLDPKRPIREAVIALQPSQAESQARFPLGAPFIANAMPAWR